MAKGKGKARTVASEEEDNEVENAPSRSLFSRGTKRRFVVDDEDDE
jgi:hypothetical protein